MWESLSRPWQAALEMTWEAYCNGTTPIGAVIVDADGNIISRGRNRIQDESLSAGQISSNNLAHAEINALLSLKLNREDARQSALYTTVEPCPLCMGALYMSDVKTLHFASRDPWAGSTNLLNATPYLSQKAIKVFAPYDTVLENVLVALNTEYMVHRRGEQEFFDHPLFDAFHAILPSAVEKGIALHRSGELRTKQKEELTENEVFNWLANQVQ
jgi:tRNA(adenine34) deaminase